MRVLLIAVISATVLAGCAAVHTDGLYRVDTYRCAGLQDTRYPVADSLVYFREVVDRMYPASDADR